ncbi:hypothetical protein EV286_11688 [Rhizobium sp. BK251]|nr:hypothetical protein EV286_11688 [Rhizobium sp. BK251]
MILRDILPAAVVKYAHQGRRKGPYAFCIRMQQEKLRHAKPHEIATLKLEIIPSSIHFKDYLIEFSILFQKET